MKSYRATLYDRSGEIERRFRARSFHEATLLMWEWISKGHQRYQPRALVETSDPVEQLALTDAAT